MLVTLLRKISGLKVIVTGCKFVPLLVGLLTTVIGANLFDVIDVQGVSTTYIIQYIRIIKWYIYIII